MKRALSSITETAAVTWAPERIPVDGITPGGTATEMIEAWEAATPGAMQKINASVPLGRMTEPVEVAQDAAWLLSDRAAMVIVPVDGARGPDRAEDVEVGFDHRDCGPDDGGTSSRTRCSLPVGGRGNRAPDVGVRV